MGVFRVAWKVAIVVALFLMVGVAVGPFFIPSESIQRQGQPEQSISPKSQFVALSYRGYTDVNVHYLRVDRRQETACRRTIILLHGFTLNAFSWQALLPVFADYGETIAYDQVPYGLSAKLSGRGGDGPALYLVEGKVAELNVLMDRLDTKNVVLVGNSAGGTIALAAALAYPEKVDALVLIAPWVIIRRPTLPTVIADLPQMRRLSLLVARYLGQGAPILRLSYADHRRLTEKRLALAGIHQRFENWDLAWGSLINESLKSKIDMLGRLTDIKMPALVVNGELDRLVPLADTKRVAGLLPNATLEIVPECGHVPQEECPDVVAAMIRGWLGPALAQVGCGDGR